MVLSFPSLNPKLKGGILFMITTKYNKNVTFTNEISVDGILAYTQNATINVSRNDFSINDWVANMDLYSANRIEIRKAKNEFEDKVFAEKEALDKEYNEMNKEILGTSETPKESKDTSSEPTTNVSESDTNDESAK